MTIGVNHRRIKAAAGLFRVDQIYFSFDQLWSIKYFRDIRDNWQP